MERGTLGELRALREGTSGLSHQREGGVKKPSHWRPQREGGRQETIALETPERRGRQETIALETPERRGRQETIAPETPERKICREKPGPLEYKGHTVPETPERKGHQKNIGPVTPERRLPRDVPGPLEYKENTAPETTERRQHKAGLVCPEGAGTPLRAAHEEDTRSPTTPEKSHRREVSVTQRVVIVMQSRTAVSEDTGTRPQEVLMLSQGAKPLETVMQVSQPPEAVMRQQETVTQGTQPQEAVARQQETVTQGTQPQEAVARQQETVMQVSQPQEAVTRQEKAVTQVTQEAVTQPQEAVTQPQEAVTQVTRPQEAVTRPQEAVTRQEKTVTQVTRPQEPVTQPQEAVMRPQEAVTQVTRPQETVTRQQEAVMQVTRPQEAVTRQQETVKQVTRPQEAVTQVTQPKEAVTRQQEAFTENQVTQHGISVTQESTIQPQSGVITPFATSNPLTQPGQEVNTRRQIMQPQDATVQSNLAQPLDTIPQLQEVLSGISQSHVSQEDTIAPGADAAPCHVSQVCVTVDGAVQSQAVMPPPLDRGPPSTLAPPSVTPLTQSYVTQQQDGLSVQHNSMTQSWVTQQQDGVAQDSIVTQGETSRPSPSSAASAPAIQLSPLREPSSPHRSLSSKPPLPTPPRSNLYPGPPDPEASPRHETASLSSYKPKAPAPDTLSYLDSVSLMSGTLESLSILDDASSLGSDSEINGIPYRRTDKYGFLGGNQYSGLGEGSIPVEIARQRELKWLDMFNHWDKWLTRRFQKVKLRCRKGIPSSLRSKAWQLLSNSHELLTKNPGKFEEMERHPGDPKWLDVIEKDLHRQFPFHEMFAARGGHGQQDLYRILKAYTVYRPEEGYCQAQAPVAAVLLMHMPAEQAFWCLVQICDKYLPGYYSAGLEAIQLDGEIFFALLRRVCPMAYRHLKKFKIDPILYMTEWFMCIFSRTLPWASVLRVWDMFFCEGVKIVFRVGLVLLRHTLGSVDKLRSCQGMYETMEKLRSLPPDCMHENVLLPEISSLPVTDALIERESNTQLRKWRENRGELQYRPSRRVHGARHLHEEKLRLNPTLSSSLLSLSSLRRPSPPPTPALQPESVVVSEGLRPALPSPTSNKTALGPPKEGAKKSKEKQREAEKRKEKEEREERKREKDAKERERQREKEERKAQKEREKAEGKQKKERKFSFRRKDSEPPQKSAKGGAESTGGAVHDTYF
ncbi:uncharacterized protein O3C94_022953 [Discoglossus pictus]